MPDENCWRNVGNAIFLVLFVLLASAPQVYGWGGTLFKNVHHEIAETAYNALPENVRAKLDLNQIKAGVVAPDQWMFEQPITPENLWRYVLHDKFPEACERAVEALGIAENHWQAGEYSSASFWLGVAGHYIQDLVSLPHCIEGGTDTQHAYFESSVVVTLTPAVPVGIENFDLYGEIASYRNGAQARWDAWLQTYDATYVQEGLNLATSLTANACAKPYRFHLPPSAKGFPSSTGCCMLGLAPLLQLSLLPSCY